MASNAQPRTEDARYRPGKTATTFAFCPSCKTLYLGVTGAAVICCRRHVDCVDAGDAHCVTTENECPTELAWRVVHYK